jgi:hypothetical protein
MQSIFDNLCNHRFVKAVVDLHYHKYSSSIGILQSMIAF